jgi:protein phosphatase PTC7
VFDGVSGADKLAGIPLYSLTLASAPASSITTPPKSTQELTSALTAAAELADLTATGASTALLASVSPSGSLSWLSLGDCSILLLRNDKVLARSKDTVHFFDCPYQLSDDSPDRPGDGSTGTARVRAGDLVVAGSDGVFDNLGDAELLELCAEAAAPKALAARIAKRAREVSLDGSARTPYAAASKRNGNEAYRSGLGGKVDDIGVVVLAVQ